MRVIVVGASVRALAESARRAGLEPLSLDFFGDLDLVAGGTSLRLDPGRSFGDAADLADRLDPERRAPVILGGALENHLHAVRELASRRPLLGSEPRAMEAARDHARLARIVKQAGLAAPEVATQSPGLPTDGTWLIKPRGSAAGRGIEPWRGQAQPAEPVYFQQRIQSGLSISALFVAMPGRCVLCGMTRQWLEGFRYRGSIGPWPVEKSCHAQTAQLGAFLAQELNLRGIFGIDLVLDPQTGVPWLIELNPRYTASVDVVELATGRSLLARHLEACGITAGDATGSEDPRRHDGGSCVGKLILTAQEPFVWRALPRPFAQPRGDLWDPPRIADIPAPGTCFQAGDPVCTLYASGDSLEDVTVRLRTAARELRSWISRLNHIP